MGRCGRGDQVGLVVPLAEGGEAPEALEKGGQDLLLVDAAPLAMGSETLGNAFGDPEGFTTKDTIKDANGGALTCIAGGLTKDYPEAS